MRCYWLHSSLPSWQRTGSSPVTRSLPRRCPRATTGSECSSAASRFGAGGSSRYATSHFLISSRTVGQGRDSKPWAHLEELCPPERDRIPGRPGPSSPQSSARMLRGGTRAGTRCARSRVACLTACRVLDVPRLVGFVVLPCRTADRQPRHMLSRCTSLPSAPSELRPRA